MSRWQSRQRSRRHFDEPGDMVAHVRSAARMVVLWTAMAGSLLGICWRSASGEMSAGVRSGLAFFGVSLGLLGVGALAIVLAPNLIADALTQLREIPEALSQPVPVEDGFNGLAEDDLLTEMSAGRR